ncbi:MAG: hypothetical protein H6629_13555 [Calditrichae bacterium]|nr:hypothetical protein [Calditrichia bacterium]
MAKKNSLFLLIQSMSPAEKRYFKLFAKMNQRNQNYLLLFDAIDSQSEYDETALKKKLKRHAFVKQLHVTKNYLIKLILKSLRNFHSQSGKTAEVKDLLRDVEILFQKEQFELCDELLQKAEKIAGEIELFPDLLEIFNWQRRLALVSGDAANSTERVNSLIQKEQDLLKLLSKNNRQWWLANNIYDEILSAQQLANGTSVTPPADLLPEKTSESIRVNILFYYNLKTFHFFTGDLPAAHRAADSLIEMLTKHPAFVQNDPAALFTAMNNKVGLCLQSRDYPAAEKLLATIREIPKIYGLKHTLRLSPKIWLQTWNMELEMHRDTQNVPGGLARAAEIREFLDQLPNDAYPDYRVVLSYQIAYFYFLNQECETALKWLNGAFELDRQTAREDLLSYAHFLRLIIHFELENFTVLKYSVESTRRFLKKKRDLHEFERQLLRFFSKASLAEPASLPDLIRQLQTSLFDGTDPARQQSVLDYLDFEQWLNRHLSDN